MVYVKCAYTSNISYLYVHLFLLGRAFFGLSCFCLDGTLRLKGLGVVSLTGGGVKEINGIYIFETGGRHRIILTRVLLDIHTSFHKSLLP